MQQPLSIIAMLIVALTHNVPTLALNPTVSLVVPPLQTAARLHPLPSLLSLAGIPNETRPVPKKEP